MTTVPLSRLDELFLILDHKEEPWNVHFEARLSGRMEGDRLADAVRVAAQRHPLARASLAPWHTNDLSYRWEIADSLNSIPLEIAHCADDAQLATARERLLGRSPWLDGAPPFTILLAHGPAADTLVLNLHHAAGDGMAAARLVRSILRAYAGEEDPVPPLDPLAVRDVRALAGAASLSETMVRSRAMLRHTVTQVGPPSRLARDGGGNRAGYGVETLALTAGETAAVKERRNNVWTVNDVLLAALVIACRRWNADHGRSARRISLSMPVNLRPPEWRTEIVGNFASYVTVSDGLADDLSHALTVMGRQTRAIKHDGLAGVVVDLLAGNALLTIGVKQRLPDLIALAGNRAVDTASLSNLGVLESFGDGVEALWFSPPGRMPLGAALGALTHDGRLHFALRYRHPQFGADAARTFMDRYREVLLG
jgi:NRPS condensation-like uncharacterized protein